MARVTLEGVSKVFDAGGKAAVRDVTLDVADGEFVVLVGPSGCGKSTTLRMIAGLETVSRGRIRIGDRDVTDVAPSDRDIAMVFQSYALYPHMTVRENLGFALALRRLPSRDVEARVRKAAEVLALGELLDRKPRQLSGGQRQRVAVGRAIVREPAVFLFDEPLSNLDAALRTQMRREIATLHRTLGATMIYVTHDQVEAMTLGDRIVVMSRGEVQQVDTPLALYAHPINRFVAGFIGSPAMNFLAGTVDSGRGALRLAGGASLALEGGLAPLASLGDGAAAVAGVRAEHLRIVEDGGSDGDPARNLQVVVELVELMGSEAYVHGSPIGPGGGPAGGHVVARARASVGVAVGDRVALAVDLDAAHPFEAGSGARVTG